MKIEKKELIDWIIKRRKKLSDKAYDLLEKNKRSKAKTCADQIDGIYMVYNFIESLEKEG